MPLQTTLPMELLGAVCTSGRAVIVHSYTHVYIVHAHTCTLSAPLAHACINQVNAESVDSVRGVCLCGTLLYPVSLLEIQISITKIILWATNLCLCGPTNTW